MARLAVVAPKNPVRLVETAAALEHAVGELVDAQVVGLDVETTLDFGALCLVQLATEWATWIVDALAVPNLDALGPLLASDRIAKVIHNAPFERQVLGRHGLEIANVFDTLAASRRVRGIDALGGHGLDVVCERELGVRLDKSEQTSMWARRPLTAAQIAYAACDAEILLELHRRLASRT